MTYRFQKEENDADSYKIQVVSSIPCDRTHILATYKQGEFLCQSQSVGSYNRRCSYRVLLSPAQISPPIKMAKKNSAKQGS